MKMMQRMSINMVRYDVSWLGEEEDNAGVFLCSVALDEKLDAGLWNYCRYCGLSRKLKLLHD